MNNKTNHKPLRIIAFPSSGISYNESLYSSIRNLGIEVLEGDPSGKWLLTNIVNTDAIHIHWPSFIYEPEKPVISKTLFSFMRFIVLIAIMRYKTKKIYWTAHNLLPHTRSMIPSLDIIARYIIILVSSKIFIHGEAAKAILIKRFHYAKNKCVTIPFGNWINKYSPAQSQESSRKYLGLPNESFLYLLFGQCKPYKNIKFLIDVFKKNAHKNDYLLIAGNFSSQEYLSQIKTAANSDSRIRIDAKFIHDEEVSYYLSASDVMCIPYKEILTSGTAMLSISFGKPVLSINRGFLHDIITNEIGVLIDDTHNEEQLENALQIVKKKNWDSNKILSHAKNFTYDDAAKITIKD